MNASAAPSTSEIPKPQVSAFVSYAREDEKERTRLTDALSVRAVSTTGDWALLQGPDYWNQIVELIKQSDVFIALISPAFADSKPSRQEVEKAGSLGKRILPVVIRQINNQDQLPASVRTPQWAFLRENDDAESALNKIARSIFSDFDDMHEHTALLVAAERWQAAGRDAGLLLRANSLEKAELWLHRVSSRGEQWYPKPTPLQEAYIRTSRKSATRRRNVGLAIGLLAMAVAIVGLVQLQTSRMKQQKAEAERAAELAKEISRAQAQEALSLIPFKPEEAAERVNSAINASRTPEALNAATQVSILRGAIDANFQVGPVKSVGFVNRDSIVALGSYRSPQTEVRGDKTVVWLRCTNKGSESSPRYQPSYVLRGESSRPFTSVASDPASSWVIAADGRTLYAWNLSSLAAKECGDLPILEMPSARRFSFSSAGVIRAVAIAEGGSVVATGDEKGNTQIRQLPSGKILNTIVYAAEWPEYTKDSSGHIVPQAADKRAKGVTALSFSRDGSEIAVATQTGAVLIWPSDHKVEKPFRIDTLRKVNGLAFHPDGKTVAAGLENGIGIYVMEAAHQGMPYQEFLQANKLPVNTVAFSPDAKYLVSGSDDQTVRIWNMDGIEDNALAAPHPRGDGRLTLTLAGHTNGVNTIAVNRTENLYATGSSDGTIIFRTFELPKAADIHVLQPAVFHSEQQPQTEVPPNRKINAASPVVAPEEQVYIAVGALDKKHADALQRVLGEYLLSSVHDDFPDGGIRYLNTMLIDRHVADEIVIKIKKAGIASEIRRP